MEKKNFEYYRNKLFEKDDTKLFLKNNYENNFVIFDIIKLEDIDVIIQNIKNNNENNCNKFLLNTKFGYITNFYFELNENGKINLFKSYIEFQGLNIDNELLESFKEKRIYLWNTCNWYYLKENFKKNMFEKIQKYNNK